MAKQTTQSIKTHKSGKAAKATLSSKEEAAASIAAKPETSPAQSGPLPEVIHLGIDVHLRQHVVCRKTDAATVQPAQRMKPQELVAWVVKQKSQAKRIVCCYEAGPFGYTLQRQLTAQGITCHVVRPQDWDRHGERVKTDSRDARELAEALARYEAGNKHALAIVRVPEVEQEQRRLITRQREGFVREVRRLGAMGRSHGMSQGHEVSGHWWRKSAWSALSKRLPQHLKDLLAPLVQVLVKLDELIAQREAEIEARATAATARPKGLGALTERIIENEVLDWTRFNNRRQVSSYTGLCPSEHSSGGKRRQGGINKHGNPRLRHALVESVWRFMRLQPGWKRLLKVVERLKGDGGSAPANKKKIAVALARELAVDLWRLNTGRSTLEALGLIAAKTAA
ncbi:MAG: IS110 family transposase [Verrucomicrobia bacterium]|nr:IS110 family transposase [Verrucomicrobiota bacterium]